MKQTFARKPLAILLSLLMVLSVFGGMAFTASAIDDPVAKIGDDFYASLQAALDAAEAGDTITLLDDLTLNAYIPVTKSLTLDGDGHTVTMKANRGIRVSESGVDVTVKNIVFAESAVLERAIQVDSDKDNVNLTIDNVTATATYYTVNVCNYVDDLNLTINNSTLTGWGVINLWGNSGTVAISGSTLNGINDKGYNADGWNDFGTIILEGDTTGATDMHAEAYYVEISNSTIAASSTTGNKQWAILHNNPSAYNTVVFVNCEVTLGEGCEFFLDQATNSITKIKDTTVNDAPYAPTAADDGYVVAEVNGYQQIIDADVFLPVVGDTYYASFEQAVEAAGDNDLTVQAPANADVSVAFTPAAAAAIADTAGDSNVYLNVKDVTTAEEAAANAKTFEITMVDDNNDPVFDEAAAAGFAKVTVPYTPAENGGDVVVYLVTNEGKVAVPCTVNANNTITFTVKHFSTYSVEQLADSVAVIESALGNKYFASLAAAIAEAANGETIKLLDDIALTASYTEIHKNITLDLNGKAVTGGALDIYADVTVKGPGSVTGTRHGIWVNPGAKVTVDGATINAGTGYSIYNEATTIIESGEVNGAISNSGNLTVNGGTLQTNDTTINAIGNVTLNGGTVIGTIYIYGSDDDTLDPGAYATLTVGEDATIDASATEFGIVIWHTNNKAYGVKVDIDGTVLGNVFVSGNVNQGSNAVINVNGTVDATDISGIGVAINGQATVNVNDGAYITSDGTGIEVRAGELNVTGGTIIGNGEYNFTPNGNGTTSTGCGIAIAQHTTEKDISVEISGDPVIEGTVALALANPQENDEGDLSVNVAGGTFTSTATEGDAVAVILDESENRVNGFISGGTFSSPIEEDYCAGDFVPATDPVVIDGQTYYIVKKETIVEDAAASAIVYGQALSASKVTANTNVAGTFAWATPNAKLTVAQSGSAFAVRFTPNDPAYNAVDLELAVEVIKATPSVKAPKAKNLTESKQAQELVTAGTTDFGTLVYALSTDGSAPADDAYSTAIPTAKDEGTYRVYYKVIGDNNVNDVEPEFVEVEITVTHMIKALRWLVDFLQSLFDKLFPLVSGQVFG